MSEAVESKRRSVTREDVGRLAGVSSAVVSYVVNNGPRPVAAATRERVLDAIEKLGYQPNAAARSLITGRAELLGLVVPDIANPYFAAMAQHVEAAARERGLTLLLVRSSDSGLEDVMAALAGRKARAEFRHGGPRLRVQERDLTERGVDWRRGRVAGVVDGRPVLDDGRVVDAGTVVWCTGFRQAFDWVDLPAFGEDGWPREYRGVVDGVPGLYFCGIQFQYAAASMVIHGVGRDAAHVASRIVRRQGSVRHTAGQAV